MRRRGWIAISGKTMRQGLRKEEGRVGDAAEEEEEAAGEADGDDGSVEGAGAVRVLE
jgi:hypothetical protein